MTVYDFSVLSAQGETKKLSDYRSKVLVIVNVASKCGFTPQYEGLEKLYQRYKDRGLVILAFPCNQFGAQEPGNDADIQSFCKLNYGVSFPVMSKIDVNGANANPLYEYLKEEAPGVLGSKAIKWNFTKFLINQEGQVLKRFAPQTTPESMSAEIESLL